MSVRGTSLHPDVHVTLKEVVSDAIEVSIHSANCHKQIDYWYEIRPTLVQSLIVCTGK